MPQLGLRFRGGIGGMVDAGTGPGGGLDAQPSRRPRLLPGWLDFSKASTWAIIYFLAALAYVLFMYFGHGGTRGAVL
jgi:hypothetical protein